VCYRDERSVCVVRFVYSSVFLFCCISWFEEMHACPKIDTVLCMFYVGESKDVV
jgi:hypothetical protein